jgi:DNA polymerase-3 subunit gamma/tau
MSDLFGKESAPAASDEPTADAPSRRTGQYVVVARRYRPQTFDELVGQPQVTQGLKGAISSDRVGHAYLFTGARGVGKTSTARILAKALNCEKGPTPVPCNECDICRAIASGEDIDVLEIDGASHRGIDEIRQLRSNVNVRPSRARYKIYIIDEVHMLTVPAFNALLKTLEEPPEHVKFIFCTTDPEKVPITVLSRCQRFDFAPVESAGIIARLQQIVEAEGVEAEHEALALLARRAGGSMRDSQSLLDQLLSCGEPKITAADVHSLLGTAANARLAGITTHLIARDTAAALAECDAALSEGVDAGQLAEQLLGRMRDMMAAAVGCPAEMMLSCTPGEAAELADSAKQMGLATILAAMQILDQTVTQMRQSAHVRTLVELAVVRICRLEDLERLPELIGQLREGSFAPPTAPGRASAESAAAPGTRSPAAPRAEKKTHDAVIPHASDRAPRDVSEVATPHSGGSPMRRDRPESIAAPHGTSPAASPRDANEYAYARYDDAPQEGEAAVSHADSSPPVAQATRVSAPPRPESPEELWRRTLAHLGEADITTAAAAHGQRATAGTGDRLVVTFSAAYNHSKQACERPERKQRIEQALSHVAGRTMRVDFVVDAGAGADAVRAAPQPNRRQRMIEAQRHPLVRQAIDLFDGEVVEVEQVEVQQKE